MINKKLIAFDRGAMRFVGANVAFQWLGMLCNIIFVRAVAQLVGAVFAGELTHEMCSVCSPSRCGMSSPCWHPA